MLTFGRVGFLVAGLLAALLPLVLHFIARRPPERRPFPTARFLRRDPRTAIRLRRRPTDFMLLALRMVLLVLLGAAFADPRWVPERAGTANILLVDRSTYSAGGWNVAMDTARHLLPEDGSTPAAALILFDTAAAVLAPSELTPERIDSLSAAGPSNAPPAYTAALRAIPEALRALPAADSVRVTLVSDLRWEGWRDGLATLREVAWPGAVQIISMPAGPRPEPAVATNVNRGTAVVVADDDAGAFTRRALEASGWSVVGVPSGEVEEVPEAEVYFLVSSIDRPDAEVLLDRLRSGATVVAGGFGVPEPLRGVLPWSFDESAALEPLASDLHFGAGPRLPGAEAWLPGYMAEGATLLATAEDGRAMAAAVGVGEGCAVFLATPAEGGSLPLSPAYPAALDRLALGCAGSAAGTEGAATGTDDRPLDAGARSVLAGANRPRVVEARSVVGRSAGNDLWPWLLLLAAVTAAVETLLAYRRP